MRLQGWEVSSGKRHAPDLNATEVGDMAVPYKVRKTSVHRIQWCKICHVWLFNVIKHLVRCWYLRY